MSSKEPSHLARLGKRLKAQTVENFQTPSSGTLAGQAVKAGAVALGNFLTSSSPPSAVPPQSLIINQPLADRPLPRDLPAPCVEKINALSDKVDGASRRVTSISEDLHGRFDPSGRAPSGLWDDVRHAKARLQELRGEHVRIHDRSRDERGVYRDASLRQAEENVRASEAKVQNAQRLLASASAEKKAPARLLERTRNWLDKNRAKHFALHEEPSTRTETSIPALWEALETARKELTNVQSAEPSAAERRAAVTAYIESEAARGRPKVKQSGKVSFPYRSTAIKLIASPDGPVPIGGESVPDTTALVCWLHKDALLERLLAELPASGGLTAKAKATKIAQLEAEILDIERAECSIIEASKGTIQYRADTDIRAFLGLE